MAYGQMAPRRHPCLLGENLTLLALNMDELTCPIRVSLAAAWSRDIINDICRVLVAEAKSKAVDVLLGPTGKYSKMPAKSLQ